MTGDCSGDVCPFNNIFFLPQSLQMASSKLIGSPFLFGTNKKNSQIGDVTFGFPTRSMVELELAESRGNSPVYRKYVY